MKKQYIVYWELQYNNRRYLKSIKVNREGWSLHDYNFDSSKQNGFCFSDYDTADLHAEHLSAISNNGLYRFGIEEMQT